MEDKRKKYKWTYYIEPSECMTCATCELECRDDAIYVQDLVTYAIDEAKCNRCARCYNACPVNAVKRIPYQQAS